MNYSFHKDDENDKIFSVYDQDNPDGLGEMLFSFDGKTVFNFFCDYPHKLSNDQIELFKKEKPMLAKLKEPR
ncbi:MAG: DUF7675 family protein [Treponemataceae bacterium]